ncbi:MAG TPA: c-type cytochrome [Chitinophagales bacterium]|nr:c-type cytochrome [Chitinophagales bacterium]HRK26689.1 c-type cytochrome [Chitinophagales bacterium]
MFNIRLFNTLLLFISLFALSVSVYAQDGADPRAAEDYKKGQTIFTGQCTSCHKINQKLVGPALAGVYDKYDRDWLLKWIKNSQELVKANDPKAVAIFNEYNKSVMPAFSLTDAEVDAVLTYIKVETENPVAAAAPAGGGTEAAPAGGSDKTITLFLGIIAAVLLIVLLILSRISGALNNMLREKAGQLLPDSIPLGKILFSKKMTALLSLAAIIFLGYATVDSATKLGRQQGYAPAQPIKFSHQLHAGVNKIDCQYCHSGASKGKSAVVPSPSLCMNCHKAINQGPKYGTTEIAKIYDAVGWDPDKMQYKPNYVQKPIEWVRIHNLPDHVYFNHSQHVNAGGVACQTCHGAVEEMEVLTQHSSLGMGWCVNCHRQTSVNFGNEFYKSYEKIHDDLKTGKVKQVTVEDIGGLECQKCHY